MNHHLGCLTLPGLIGGVFALLVIAILLIFNGGAMFSPGPLSAMSGDQPLGGVTAHAELSTRCESCHTAPWDTRSMTDQCLSCHTAIAAELSQAKTLHGLLFSEAAGKFNCVNCHTEHAGPTMPLTHYNASLIDHNVFGFSLAAHPALACQDCHQGSFKLPFNQAACKDCHNQRDAVFLDQHLADFGANCIACHDGLDRYGKAFSHDLTAFPLTGKHAAQACAACHAGAVTMSDLQQTTSACQNCHQKDDIHRGQLGNDCAQCHTPSTWKGAVYDHSLTTFPLIGAHLTVTCAACHPGHVYKETAATCVACHAKDDAHNGQLSTACEKCHSPVSWKNVSFDHAATAFPLTGAHTKVACTACHADLTFKQTPSTCQGCHAADDIHKGQLGADCAACHTTASWKGAVYDHSKTAFPLTGAHTAATCTACHPKHVYKGTSRECSGCHTQDDIHKGTLGVLCSSCHTTTAWKPSTYNHKLSAFQLTGAHTSIACASCHPNNRFKGTPSTCYGCHSGDDAHSGSFGTACDTCHSTTTWKGATFDHAITGFPLTGAHTRVDCAACHPNNRFKGTPSTCYGCHSGDDAHAGAFGTDCGSCHSTSSWEGASFNHNITGFALTGAHARANCASCHPNNRFKGTPSDCAGCHSDPAWHQGAFGTACDSCHNTTAWTPANFNLPHTFPTGHGGASSCSTCHPSNVNSYTCFDCHDQGETQKHHAEEGINDISDCARCHPTGDED